MTNTGWIEISEDEFLELKKIAVTQHTLRFVGPALVFYWDAEGSKNEDLSWGKHSFLKHQPESTGPAPFIWPNQYWRKNKKK